MGDPAGIGPEVVAKALAKASVRRGCRLLVIGSFPAMERALRLLKSSLKAVLVTDVGRIPAGPNQVAVLDPLPHPLGVFEIGKAAPETGAASVVFITEAVRLAQAGLIDAMVTAPINKEAMHMGGYRYPGHTELLADLTKSTEVGMMILGGPLKIMFTTTHVALRELPVRLTVPAIVKAIRLADLALRESFRIRKPRIGVAALNPHAGEHGLFGDEEQTTIQPAVDQARQTGIDASGPLPADTLFGKAARGAYDGVVALYHDQGLIPLKLVAFGTCVNMTVGLPIIRTSVDHGTAYDIAGRGVAEPGSLIEAIKLGIQLVRIRRQSSRTLSRRPSRQLQTTGRR